MSVCAIKVFLSSFLDQTARVRALFLPRASCRRNFWLVGLNFNEKEAEKQRTPYGRDRRIFRRGGQDHWYGGHVV